jgi:hypothetical protein
MAVNPIGQRQTVLLFVASHCLSQYEFHSIETTTDAHIR